MGSLQLQDFAAGWVGGAASVVVGHPLDTIKTRLQAGQGYGNTLSCVLTVYRNESVAGFFKGMSFPLASIAVYSSVVFGVFSNTQRLLSHFRHGDPARAPVLADVALASIVAGFISVGIGTPVDLVKIRLQMQTQPYIEGAISWVTATPMDVVKSRLQADGVHLNKYKGTLDCILQSYRNEGLKCCQEDLKVSYFPEPNQQCGGGEGSAALTEDSCSCTYGISIFFCHGLSPWRTPKTAPAQSNPKTAFFIKSFTLLSKSTLIIPILVLGFFTDDIFPIEPREQLTSLTHTSEIYPKTSPTDTG
ncbi:solute carrier family 25 member 48 isoform X4 [Larus michahellis]|uniref:solute carrier family 25 member 48 isoform X4 n=1 Tax=Larus michahellis TaxID=119627 RepID=UPI003D9B8206